MLQGSLIPLCLYYKKLYPKLDLRYIYVPFPSADPNPDLLCIRQLDDFPICENYAKLYFDVKHLEKELNRV